MTLLVACPLLREMRTEIVKNVYEKNVAKDLMSFLWVFLKGMNDQVPISVADLT